VSLLQRESLSIVLRKVAPSSPAIRLEDSAAIIVSGMETLNDVQGVFARSCESSHNCGNSSCMNALTFSSALSTFRF
jgi:hypothetical protein